MLLKLLLRLTPQFQQIEAELKTLRANYQDLTTENLLLQDRLDAAREDRTKMWDTMQECLRGERTAYQMHINQAWQKTGAGAPYPDAPQLPPHMLPKQETHEPIGRRRVLPSEVVAQKTAEYVRGLVPTS